MHTKPEFPKMSKDVRSTITDNHHAFDADLEGSELKGQQAEIEDKEAYTSRGVNTRREANQAHMPKWHAPQEMLSKEDFPPAEKGTTLRSPSGDPEE
jgi:hypothetical protein